MPKQKQDTVAGGEGARPIRGPKTMGRGNALPPAGPIHPSDLPEIVYDDARHHIKNGDCLLYLPRVRWWRPDDWWTRLIQWSSPYGVVHCGMAGWWGNNLMRVQMTSSPDRTARLSEEVARWPGRIIWCTWKKAINMGWRTQALSQMIDICQRQYGWANLVRTAVWRHTRLGGILPRHDTTLPPYCSMSYTMAWREVSVDPCPGLNDWAVEPADLYASPKLEPCGRLV
jgi:hypothetical protein